MSGLRRAELPAEGLAGKERDDGADALRHRAIAAFQRHRALVQRKPVEARPVFRSEGFEMREGAVLIEHRGISLEREGRVEDARASAARFLGIDGVRSAVGAEKKFG